MPAYPTWKEGLNAGLRTAIGTIELVRRGTWSLDKATEYLTACLGTDEETAKRFISEVKASLGSQGGLNHRHD